MPAVEMEDIQWKLKINGKMWAEVSVFAKNIGLKFCTTIKKSFHSSPLCFTLWTMDGFILVPDLAGKAFIIDWPLSRILLQSSKDFPWILLVPRLPGISQMHELREKYQMQLMREISAASRIMVTHFSCDRVNVAAMGNKVPQLHIHVVCRDREDPYWPETIWHQPYVPLGAEELETRRKQLSDVFHRQSWEDKS